MRKIKGKTKNAQSVIKTKHNILSLIYAPSGGRRRLLSEDEKRLLVLSLARESSTPAFDLTRLVPDGSFLKQMMSHFTQTDISFALPLFEVIMITASWLTQNGAKLELQGVEPIVPTLWSIGLADSGSSKTFAADRIMKILTSEAGCRPVVEFPPVTTDAQWIMDLSANNGAYWSQDEVGKLVHGMNTSKRLERLKPWMLDAYSYKKIGNRLKGDSEKLEIENPHFTFHGLTVRDTWPDDVNALTMADGWCQRMNFYIAPPRTDTTMFDHFLYFTDSDVVDREAKLRKTWLALCEQSGATDTYQLHPSTLRYLQDWWKGLETSWGDFSLPASFLRRIGFSVARYLIVIQFLLGKSRHHIDIETAQVATAFAEFHMESAHFLVQSYDQTAASHVQKVAKLYGRLKAEGKEPTPRNINQRLSKAARRELPCDMIRAITCLFEKIESSTLMFGEADAADVKAEAIQRGLEEEQRRLKRNERKRNERRLREVIRAYDSKLKSQTELPDACGGLVIDFDDFQKPTLITVEAGSNPTSRGLVG